jgi:GTP-binding protein Era
VSKPKLLPLIEHYSRAHPFVEIVPISAADGTNLDVLEKLFVQHLPDGEPLYPADYVTDQPERFFIGEIIREQVLAADPRRAAVFHAVIVDRLEPAGEDRIIKLYCTILVDRTRRSRSW